MVKYYDQIPPHLLNWIPHQHVFYVATAPLQPDGRVNLSPKGYEDTFHIVNTHQVWYEDLSGSGIETVSHVRENGRITLMFVAFQGPPNIVRLYGKGTVHEFGTDEYDHFIPPPNRKPGSRAVIVVDITQVSTSCGYGVPFFDYARPRTTLLECFSARESFDVAQHDLKTERGLKEYWKTKNAQSLDGLPGLTVAAETERSFVTSNHVHTHGQFPRPVGKKEVVMPPPHKDPATTVPGEWQSTSITPWWTGLVAGITIGVLGTTLVKR